MSRRHAGSTDSQEPDDEVMPYSDDETDDELDASTDEDEEEVPGAPHPPAEPHISGETHTQAKVKIRFCSVTMMNNLFQRWHGRWKPTIGLITICQSFRRKSSCVSRKADTRWAKLCSKLFCVGMLKGSFAYLWFRLISECRTGSFTCL